MTWLEFDKLAFRRHKFEDADATQELEQWLDDEGKVCHTSYKGIQFIMVTETIL